MRLDLIRFLGVNALIGMAGGWAFAGMVIAFDVGGLGTLIAGSSAGVLAGFLLAFFCGLTFGSVQMGLAVIGLGRDRSCDGGRLVRSARGPVAGRQPVPAVVRRRRTDRQG